MPHQLLSVIVGTSSGVYYITPLVNEEKNDTQKGIYDSEKLSHESVQAPEHEGTQGHGEVIDDMEPIPYGHLSNTTAVVQRSDSISR